MAPNGKPTLIYFDFTGRAENIRMAFHIGGIEFEDKRITGEEFDKMKADFPFGHIPVMEIDGDYTSQSMALLYYAGIRSKLLPEGDVMKMKVMEFVFGLEDLLNRISPSMKEEDKQKQLEMRKVLANETIPYFLEKLDKLAMRNSKSDHCVGETMTIADLFCYNMLGWLKSGHIDNVPTTIGDKYARLTKVYNAVLKHPKVVSWNAMPHGKKPAVANGH